VNLTYKRAGLQLGYLCVLVGVALCINAADVVLHRCAPVRHADAALVLGAGVVRGEPSAIFKGRLTTAAELFHEGVVSTVVVSGAARSNGESSEAEAGARFVEALGVPSTQVIQESQARNTHDNLVLGAREIERNGARTWIVVSDHYHLRRAELLSREAGLPFACVASRYQRSFDLPFLFREVMKVVVLRIRWVLRTIAGNEGRDGENVR
jgi:uncharacterized SAM-binding protein YcdF (DUF218 family)